MFSFSIHCLGWMFWFIASPEGNIDGKEDSMKETNLHVDFPAKMHLVVDAVAKNTFTSSYSSTWSSVFPVYYRPFSLMKSSTFSRKEKGNGFRV